MVLLRSQLKAAARSIYNTYLSDSAPYSVNIDDTAKTEEKDLEQPTPDMFNKAQTQVCLSTLPFYPYIVGVLADCVPLFPALFQIFKLMKMDSYRRFVRSPLYHKCTLASAEGKLSPQLSTEHVRMGSWEDVATRSQSLNEKKVE